MPPDGVSAIPASLESVVPEELRYWKATGSEAREMRDALVDAKLCTPDTVKIVNGEFRKVVNKSNLDLGGAYRVAFKRDLVRFGLACQFWKGEQADKPSRQMRHLVLERKGGGFDAWSLSADPMSADQISATHRVIEDDSLLTFNGDVDPGQEVGGEVLNQSKSIPSWIRNLDTGKAELIESKDGLRKVRFRGKLSGVYKLAQEEEGSAFWSMTIEERAVKGRSASAGIFVKRDRLRFVQCPACDGINLRTHGMRKLESGELAEVIECNECAASFGVRGDVIDRNTMRDDVPDDLDNALPDDNDPIVIKAVPVQNGIQIWGSDEAGLNADRSQLRPLAFYQPMAHSDPGEDIFKRFATSTMLGMGVIVEPRYDGVRLSLQKRGSKTLIFSEGDQRDLSASLPNLVKDLRALPGDFVLDAVGMVIDGDGGFVSRKKIDGDEGLRVSVFDSLFFDGANLMDKAQTDRRRKAERLLCGDHDRLSVTPAKVVRTKGELEDAIAWACGQPGSRGAALKGVEATYSPGQENDLWTQFDTPADLESALQINASKLIRGALSKKIPVVKTEEERFVLGIVLEPNDGEDGAPLDPDTQKDIYSAEEIRQAAHKFMEEYRNLGVMHSELANDKIKILESYIAPADFILDGTKIRKGTWLLAVRVIDDTLWQCVKRGELTGFSIGGSAMRSPVKE